MSTPLSQVAGIGPKTAEYLSDRGITTVEALLQAGVAALVEAPGFGEGRANTVVEAARDLLGSVVSQSVKGNRATAERKKEKSRDTKKGGKGSKQGKPAKKKDKDSDKKKDKKKGKKDKKDKKGKKKKK